MQGASTMESLVQSNQKVTRAQDNDSYESTEDGMKFHDHCLSVTMHTGAIYNLQTKNEKLECAKQRLKQ